MGEGQRDESGEIRVLSGSTMSLSSPSTGTRRGLRDEGDEKEKSSNMVSAMSLIDGWVDWRSKSQSRCKDSTEI